MKSRLLLLLIMLFSLALSFTSHRETVLAQAAPQARLRVIHAVDGAPEVDVYIDSVLAATGLGFGSATPHFKVPAGGNQVDVRLAGADPASTPVFTQIFDLQADLAFSLVVQGAQSAPTSILYEDVLDSLDTGLSRLTAIHAITGAEPVDILRTDGAPLMLAVSFGVPYGTINIPAGSYEVVAVPTGSTPESALTAPTALDLHTNVLYTLLIVPDGTSAQIFVLTSAVNPAPDTVLARFANAAGTDAVDVYLDETLILSNLGTGQLSLHVGLASGEHELALREAGSPPNADAIFSDSVTLGEDAQTVAVLGSDDDLSYSVIADDIADLTAEQARVQVVNLSGDAVSLDFVDGDALADALADGEAGDALDVAPAAVEIEGDADLSGDLYGGTLYSVLAFPDGDFVLAATPLNVGLTSTPLQQAIPEVAANTDTTTDQGTTSNPAAAPTATLPLPTPVATAQTAPTAEVAQVVPSPTVAPLPTVEQPLPQVATPTPVPPADQALPVAQPNARPTKPGIYPPVDIIFGVVNLNQGVNLQCREYPSTAARSLGLIPNGTELVVIGLFAPRDETGDIGRTDALVIEGIPDFTPLLDFGDGETDPGFLVEDFPADFLAPLEPELLWLNVDWRLPDGTPFGCWVNAQYVEINHLTKRIDEITEYLQLVKDKNFELVPYNLPGGPRDPDVIVSPQDVSQPTPLPANDELIATVNVNRGVNLQLRRTPGTDGESIALVPGGTQLEVLGKTNIPPTGNIGEPTIPEWLYAEMLQPDGSLLRGYISGEYVILTQTGRLITLEDIPVLETIERGGPVDEDGIPLSSSGVPIAPAATPQFLGRMLTDPGLSLNLRNQPSDTALVTLSIPSGTPLTVLGRNGAGTWLNISLQAASGEVSGWVLAQFVEVSSAQGTPVGIGDLPITNGETNTFDPNAPVPAPTQG